MVRVFVDLEHGGGLVPAAAREPSLLVHVEVEANHELAMVVQAVDWFLKVAVPNQRGHVVAATREDVCVVWRKLYPLHCELMTL